MASFCLAHYALFYMIVQLQLKLNVRMLYWCQPHAYIMKNRLSLVWRVFKLLNVNYRVTDWCFEDECEQVYVRFMIYHIWTMFMLVSKIGLSLIAYFCCWQLRALYLYYYLSPTKIHRHLNIKSVLSEYWIF